MTDTTDHLKEYERIARTVTSTNHTDLTPEQARDAQRGKLQPIPRYKKQSKLGLTEEQILDIVNSSKPLKAIAQKYGTTTQAIINIRKRWS